MKYQVFKLTLFLLRIAYILCSNTITDCELSYDYMNSQETVTLFCGRPAERCRYDYHYNYNDCSELCYNQIFSNENYQSTLIRSLKIGDCRGNLLNTIIGQKFTELKKYDISNHGIRSLSSSDLNFRELKVLNAKHNHLVNISDSLFINTPAITEIDFSHNEIATIHPGAFKGVTLLYSLDLSNNLIKTLDKNSFEDNKNLQMLKLSDNPIQRIDEKIFTFVSQFPSLKLYLSCETIYDIDGTSCGQFLTSNYLTLRCSSVVGSQLVCTDSNFINLKYFNISGNQLQNVDHLLNTLVDSPIETLDLSLNHMSVLNANSFSKFINLKYLDVRNTKLSVIDFPFAQYHKKLEVLRLENNPIKRIDCNIFSLLLKSTPITITITTNNVSEIDTSCMKISIKIIELNNNDEIAFRSVQTNSELRCKKSNFQQLTYFNIMENQLLNAPSLLDLLGPLLETLDVSHNHVGKITSRTFERFTNLKYLNLSHTNLSNFQFSTFYHQRRLKMLDISYNHLGSVNFTLFLRIFKDLETLNLEGNDLIEVNSVTRLIFPKLFWLGISKNHFSCDYLRQFLPEWMHINLLDNPSNQTHIDGIDCHHNDGQQTNAISMATTTQKPSSDPELTNPVYLDSTTEKSTAAASPDHKAIINVGFDTHFSCNAFFDGNTSISCDKIQEIDMSCLGTALEVIIDSGGGLSFHQPENYSNHRNDKELHCPKKDLQYIKHVNISGNQLENAPQIIGSLSPSIETLDLSSNFIGKLNVSTFQPFNNLQYLNLSRTHLSNFSFDTFFHQAKLSVLDLSYNNLRAVNFTLFLRNFKNLHTLNLEGNDFMEIDTVTRFNFPKLSLLGISQNHFSCDYLISFLRPWDNLQLMHNPWENQTHIDGINCYSKSQNVTNRIGDVKAKLDEGVQLKAIKSQNKQNKESEKSMEPPKPLESHLSADMQMLKYIFLGICVIWCLNFIIKSEWFSDIRRKMNRNTSERVVAYQPQREHDAQQSIELIEKGSIKE